MHTIPFQIRNKDRKDTSRPVEVHATPEEIRRLGEDGYLVRERLFSPEQVETLRVALGELLERDLPGGIASLSPGQQRDAVYLRHLMDKHAAFLKLFRFQPLLSVARALLGPQVQVLPMTARVSHPYETHVGTRWHIHQRVIPEPMPRFFTRPHVLDCLIYLDDVTEDNGPLSVIPGTHHVLDDDLSGKDYGDLPGQVTLYPAAGSCVIVHGALWHRAHPTTARGSLRRMLILPYAAAWLKLPSYGARPTDGLMRSLYENADAETKELLGVPEGLY